MEQERLEDDMTNLGEIDAVSGVLHRLVSSLSEPLLLVEVETGAIESMSAKAAQLLGDAHRIGDSEAESAESAGALQDAFRTAAQTSEPFERTIASETDPVRVLFQPVVSAADVALFRVENIGAEREHEQRRAILQGNLDRAERFDAAGRVAGVVAHEFNNFLAIILNHADLLREDAGLTGEALEDAEQIRDAAIEAAELTRRLLLFGRNDMSKPQFVGVHRSLEDIVEEFHERHDLEVETEIVVGHDSSIWVHPVRWTEAVLHLLENAIEASNGESPTLSAKTIEMIANNPAGIAPGNYVEFSISDDGSGMNETVARRAFEPFFSTKDRLGAGLGLSLAYGIATSLGGHIHIESAVGDGTTVTLLLPEHDEEASESTEKSRPNDGDTTISTAARTILVVEDEPGVLRAVQRILSANGYELLTASSGAEALNILDDYEADIHLLLTDVVMPGMSGVQLAKRVMRKRDEIKILYMSGYTESALSLDQLVAGKTDLILKPFTASDLLEVVEFQLSQ